jgi:hypothetical protein
VSVLPTTIERRSFQRAVARRVPGPGDGSMQGRIKRKQHLIEAFRLLFEAKKREQKDKERL